jgi:hypothetical protein
MDELLKPLWLRLCKTLVAAFWRGEPEAACLLLVGIDMGLWPYSPQWTQHARTLCRRIYGTEDVAQLPAHLTEAKILTYIAAAASGE